MRHHLGGVKPESEAEHRALKAWCDGIPADCRDLTGDNKTIRGDFLARLLRSDPCLSPDPGSASFQVTGATIKGTVDLHHANVPKACDFLHCTFDGGFSASNSRFPRLFFNHSKMSGCLVLSNATIDGPFGANGATFIARDGKDEMALNAQGLSAKGFFMLGASVSGTCFIGNATINGQFAANDATFTAREGKDEMAIMAQGLSAKGFFMRGANVSGTCFIGNATIDGQFGAEGATFTDRESKDEEAILADFATITGGVLFRTQGETRPTLGGKANFCAANIGTLFDAAALTGSGKIDIGQAKLNAKVTLPTATDTGFSGSVLAEDAIIDRLILGPNNLTELNLTRTKIGTLEDEEAAWQDTNYSLDGLHYDHLERPQGPWRLDWLKRNRNGYKPGLYKQLSAELHRQGHEDDARAVTIERHREYKRSVHCHPIRRFFYNALDWSGRFGFGPERTLAISLVLIISCAIFFDLATIACADPTCRNGEVFIPMTANDVWTPNTDPDVMERPFRSFDPLLFSMDTFIPLVDFGPSGKWSVNNTAGHVDTWYGGTWFGGTPLEFKFGWLGSLLTLIVVLERILGAFLTAYLAVGLRNLVVDRRTD